MDGEPWIRFKDKVFEKWACKFWDLDKDGGITGAEGKVAQNLYTYNISEWGEEYLAYFNSAEIFDFSKLLCGTKAIGMIGTNTKELHIGRIDSLNLIVSTNYKAYNGHQHLEICDIGPVINWIERTSFKECSALKEIILNDSLLAIDGEAFMNCISLEKISAVPDTCYRMYGDYYSNIFYNCQKLKTFTIGNGMQRIGNSCFENCLSMETFYIKTITPPTLGSNVFKNNPCNIYVPRASVDTYKTATNWSAYASRIYGYDF